MKKPRLSEVDVVDVSPATELADIMLRDIGIEDINDLCTQCREELGVIFIKDFSAMVRRGVERGPRRCRRAIWFEQLKMQIGQIIETPVGYRDLRCREKIQE